jgi:hypothetical protein
VNTKSLMSIMMLDIMDTLDLAIWIKDCKTDKIMGKMLKKLIPFEICKIF